MASVLRSGLDKDRIRLGMWTLSVAFGRRGCQAGSPCGPNTSMTLYRLIEPAKANNVDPYWHVRALLELLPTFDPVIHLSRDSIAPGRMKWNRHVNRPGFSGDPNL